MKVLLIVHGFPPAANGGTEVYVEALARELRQQGDEVSVITREDDRTRADYEVRCEERAGVRIAAINNTYRATRSIEETWRNDSIGAVVSRLVDEWRPDVAHVHHLTGLSSTIPRLLADRGVPVILTLHDYWLICHRGQLLDRNYELCDGPEPHGCGNCLGEAGGVHPLGFAAAPAIRAIERHLAEGRAAGLRKAATAIAAATATTGQADRHAQMRVEQMQELCRSVTRFIAPSTSVRDRFVRFGVSPGRITVSDNGIDLQLFRKVARTPSARLRIGFVGALMMSKAPHVLLQAFDRLPPGSATLDLYGNHAAYHGDDSYRARLEPMLKRPGVRVHGAVGREAIARAFESLDVLVVPSIWPETSSLVIREAFAAGVPVVASRIGAIPEIVEDGRNGLLFEPGDAEDLARALQALIDVPSTGGRHGMCRVNAPPVRSIQDDARATRGIYRETAGPDATRARNVAAVVLNYRTPDETRLAVKSLLASRTPFRQIVVVDNDERETARQALQDLLPSITYLHTGQNLGFSGGMNAGIRRALADGADAVLLTNSDVIVPPDCLERLDQALRGSPAAGIAGPAVLARSDPGRVASLGMHYAPFSGRMRHAGYGASVRSLPEPQRATIDGVSGCLMMVRRKVFEAIGLLDDDFFFSFEDLDFCLRAKRAGFATILAVSAVVYHQGSRSMGHDTPRRLFFATRNHLLLGKRAAPDAGPLTALCRTSSILLLNVAHAVRSRGSSLPVRLTAVARGALDYSRGRFGADS